MKEQEIEMRKKIGMILLCATGLFAFYFLLFAPVSPLKGDLHAAASAVPLPASGIWGKIGFYERPADNSITYCLMLMFFSTAVYKLLRMIFPAAQRRRLRR